ncbi:hypothetical protein Pma05_76370 [Plantactinospora mayteni]|uniref:Uncharacterized protein n=1 Tax=Plantactinospora mayteni TaxID=566021 RepID=A0ABQ4F2C6_9ACTN|nr:hypothetical protein Pma05_76370 [Plantactinospora mayteni]
MGAIRVRAMSSGPSQIRIITTSTPRPGGTARLLSAHETPTPRRPVVASPDGLDPVKSIAGTGWSARNWEAGAGR